MRGRRPRRLAIDPTELTILQRVARSDSLPWYQVRRARIVLANARGVHNSTVAFPVLIAILFGAAILVSTIGSGVTLRRFLRV